MNALPRALVFSLALAGCSPSEGDGGGGPPPVICPIATAPAAPTFAAHVAPALRAGCGSESTTCHGAPKFGELPKGKIDFSNEAGRTAANVYADLVNKAPDNAPAGYVLVKPGDAAASWLAVKVTDARPGGEGYGEKMPLGSDLCSATRDTFVAWISQGAPP